MADNKERIKRSPLLSHPLSGRAGLLREIGASYDHGAVFGAWARSLGGRQISICSPKSDFTNFHNTAFTTFIHDEAIQSIIAGLEKYAGGRFQSSIMILGKDANLHKYRLSREESYPQSMVTVIAVPVTYGRMLTAKKVTSMSVSPSRIVLATTRGGLQPASLYPLDLDEIGGGGYVRRRLFGSTMVPNPAGIYWASAANPRNDICAFAIAASNGSVLLHESEGRWSLQRSQCPEGRKEAVAIDWLSPSVILKGCREGAVRLWDTRSRAESSEPRIQHPIAITHVRSINDNFVVVAGLQHQLCTYDLRFANRANPDQATQYYDWYPTYRNNVLSHHSIGLDVHRNLVAAATDDRRVQIFDIKQGVELKSGLKTFGANAACVRFVDEQTSGNGLKLMVAAGPKIDEWAFEGSREKGLFDEDRTN